jgi:hypothetical protein
VTVPVIVVLVVAVQAITCEHSGPVQAGAAAHVFATPAPPQVSPVPQVPQLAVSPPQPSATTPHVAPAWAHVRGVHDPGPLPPPHVNRVPPPPQVSGAVHVPQSITPPQPSPIGPHVAFRDAHVTRPHPGPSVDASLSGSPSEGALVL